MKRLLLCLMLAAAPGYADPCKAAPQYPNGDTFSFVFVDTAAPEDTLIVIADNYDEAVDLYSVAQKVDRTAVIKRFQIYDVGTIRANQEEIKKGVSL